MYGLKLLILVVVCVGCGRKSGLVYGDQCGTTLMNWICY